MKQKWGTVGFIGRFKPLHNGAAAALEALCEDADFVKIGIGSANKYNVRNPFTAKETEEMIRAHLTPRFSHFQIYHIPDFGHIPEYADGKKWKELVVATLGDLDFFVTGNPYTERLLSEAYTIIHPKEVISTEKYIQLRATEVRVEMAKGTARWRELVPAVIAQYIAENGVLERFQREFGAATIRCAEKGIYQRIETDDEEQKHTREK